MFFPSPQVFPTYRSGMPFIFLPGDGSVTQTIVSSEPFGGELEVDWIGSQAIPRIDEQRTKGILGAEEARIDANKEQGFGVRPLSSRLASRLGSFPSWNGLFPPWTGRSFVAAAPCVMQGGYFREAAGLWIRILFLLWVLRLSVRLGMGMVTILRKAWRGSCGRGAPPPLTLELIRQWFRTWGRVRFQVVQQVGRIL